MEEETASGIVVNGRTDLMMVEEASDSNSRNLKTHVTNSSLVLHHDDNSSISSVTKFKGVVPQQNGHWGAQIYCNHKRIWLGTFKTERDAAMAYDSASIKLRSGDSHRNFPWTNLNIQEPDFQTLLSTEAVLNMIKDGSYPSKFVEYVTSRNGKAEIGINLVKLQENGGFLCHQLFQKELTPSDVGKLNRLVIPKKHAVKYFPPISENNASQEENTIADDLELAFYDRLMKSWKFRYCYWSSSQSFVFTRGWNRFVREKELKAKDIVTFYTCECKEGEKKGQTFCMIDIWYEKDRRNEDVDHQYVGMLAKDSQLEPEPNIGSKKDKELQEEELGLVETTQDSVKSSFRLFGVQICS